MVTNYKRGYQLEYRCKQLLEKNGWLSVRSPASKSPVDVFATKEGRNILIQCKKTSKAKHMYIYDLGDLVKTARKYMAIPLLVYSFQNTPVYAKEVKAAKVKISRLGKHTELEKYLEVKEINDEFNGMVVGGS